MAASSLACMPPVAMPSAISFCSPRWSIGEYRLRSIHHAGDIGEEDQAVDVPGGGDGDCHGVAVHVVNLAVLAACDTGDYGHVTGGGEGVEQSRIRTTTRPTKPSSGSSWSAMATPASMPVSPTARAPAAPESGHQLGIDGAGEDFEDGVDGFIRGDAETAHEIAFNAALFEESGHLFASAMHDGDGGCREAARAAIWRAMLCREEASSSRLPPIL